MIVVLCGGVGGAKLAQGLADCAPAGGLLTVVNTGDDFTHLGLPISPDLDTVMYTLAGIANPVLGWGQRDESWHFMAALEKLGGEAWFRLGDKDMATHIRRRALLEEGKSLSQATAILARALGIDRPILPASDQPLRTMVQTDEGELAFQHYFVRRQCQPVLHDLRYAGAEEAQPSRHEGQRWTDIAAKGIVIAPSNPYLSVAPILAMPTARKWLESRKAPAVAVSPIIGGAAVKGPAAKIMRELGVAPSALAVARFYRGLIDILMIHESDAGEADAIAAEGIRPVVTDILMPDLNARSRLARQCLAQFQHGA